MKNMVCCVLIGAVLFWPRLHAEEIGLFQAAKVARADYEKKIAPEKDLDWKWASYVANIENYSIGMSESKDYYVVIFKIRRPTPNFKGGGAQYLIRKADLRIQKFIGYE